MSVYVYLVGLSAGSYLVASLPYAFGVRRLERVGKVALFTALVTLVAGLLAIWLDLGRMEAFYRVYTSPNFQSMMAWMVWLYTAYFGVLVVQGYLALRPELTERERRVLRVLATAGVPLAVGFSGGVGALFATVSAKMYWHQSVVPLLFLAGAVLSGTGLVTALAVFTGMGRDEEGQRVVEGLGRGLLYLLLGYAVLEWTEFSVPLWYGTSPEGGLFREVLFGPYWWVFWIVHVGVGTAVPVALLLVRPGHAQTVGWAGLLAAAAFFSVRLNLVIPAQVEPALRGLERAFTGPRLVFHYVPSVHEWLVAAFVFAVAAGLLWAGTRWLPLMEREVAW